MHTFIRAYSELVWTHPVIPAKAGIQRNKYKTSRLDSCFRRNDKKRPNHIETRSSRHLRQPEWSVAQ